MEAILIQEVKRTSDEQYRLIIECRSSGLSDFQWYNEHGIRIWVSSTNRFSDIHNIHALLLTKEKTMPNIEAIWDILKEMETFVMEHPGSEDCITERKSKNEYDDRFMVYYVGDKSKNRSYPNACCMRKVSSMRDSLEYEEILTLMAVEFVRNSQYTVLLFPFMYLREYMKQS